MKEMPSCIILLWAHMQEDKRSFITFHDDKPLEPLVLGEKWEDFNLKVNTTIAKILQWVRCACENNKIIL